MSFPICAKVVDQVFGMNLIFLKICKGLIHDIYVTERKRLKLLNDFTLSFSSFNIGIALHVIERRWT